MESFLYPTLNTATREHDLKKVASLGPMAWALMQIVKGAESNRPKDPESLPVEQFTGLYRGLNMPTTIIQQYKNKSKEKYPANQFYMGGFISTC